MKWQIYTAAMLALSSLSSDLASIPPDWGFFGHRRINRMAVFTLPPEMMVFYKKYIEYLTEHAVDPDKRRYATKYEAPRHYIDLDHWDIFPFLSVPRDWTDALMKFTDLLVVTPRFDTIHLFGNTASTPEGVLLYGRQGVIVEQRAYRLFFQRNILPQYYEDDWYILCDSLWQLLGYEIPCRTVLAMDRFSEHGILPYHLLKMQRDLTEAFRQKNATKILRLSAEIGHYISDAHVPLHTTENYNGQLTNQFGIHAFWESRLPELYADSEYDFFVGKAAYIDQLRDYFWQIVLDSHALLDSVLLIEKDLSRTFPPDRQYCYEERLGQTIRTQCSDYADAYHQRMNGMVERRMRAAIHAVASSWYTAWVDAGQPDLRSLVTKSIAPVADAEAGEIEYAFQRNSAKGREHNDQ